MTNTPFSKRVEILTQIADEIDADFPCFSNVHEFEDFAFIHSYAFAVANCVQNRLATPTDKGIEHVNYAWDSLCDMLSIDNYGEYDTIDQMVEFSDEQG